MPETKLVVQIHDLTSSKGLTLNGLGASVDVETHAEIERPITDSRRFPVSVDGLPGQPLAIKAANLHLFLPDQYEYLCVAVGRRDLRSKDFMATVIDQTAGKNLTAQILSSPLDGVKTPGALRTHGSLRALLEFFQGRVPFSKDILFDVTDLNLALALNNYCTMATPGGPPPGTVALRAEQDQHVMLQKIGKLVARYKKIKKRSVLFKYKPFRLQRFEADPKAMVYTVRKSTFHIYPCPCDTYQDGLEVRYLLPGRSTHSFFLDFGQDETIQYVRNVYNMDSENMNRLKPEVLADVDPQMFWSSVLHSKAVVKELGKLQNCPENLLEEWKVLFRGYLSSVTSVKDTCCSPSEAVRILPDHRGAWNLINEEIHGNIALRNAKLAIVLSLTEWILRTDLLDTSAPFPSLELMDNYVGTDIDEAVAEFTKAASSGDKRDLHLALQCITTWKETRTCDHCGKYKKTMYDCSKCKSVGYCDRKCQEADWPRHKPACKELRKTAPPETQDSGLKVDTKLYKSKTSRRAEELGATCLFTEACGVGFLRILWVPGNESANTMTFSRSTNDAIFKTELAAMPGGVSGRLDPYELMTGSDFASPFKKDFSDLAPVVRLCMACGPIPNLEVAQRSVDDALAQVRGSVDRLRMDWVGFSPLEWAAKKGHLDIVEWLLSDSRTAGLVSIGAPIGWACYTNNVEIAKLLLHHGASPEATDRFFWDNRPPLLAAAENGKLKAVKFLAEDCGIGISLKWKGNGIIEHVKMSPNYRDQTGHMAVIAYAKEKLT